MVFKKYDLPEPNKVVIEKAIGIPVPPGWILSAREADSFIQSFFPGLATALEWDQELYFQG